MLYTTGLIPERTLEAALDIFDVHATSGYILQTASVYFALPDAALMYVYALIDDREGTLTGARLYRVVHANDPYAFLFDDRDGYLPHGDARYRERILADMTAMIQRAGETFLRQSTSRDPLERQVALTQLFDAHAFESARDVYVVEADDRTYMTTDIDGLANETDGTPIRIFSRTVRKKTTEVSERHAELARDLFGNLYFTRNPYVSNT